MDEVPDPGSGGGVDVVRPSIAGAAIAVPVARWRTWSVQNSRTGCLRRWRFGSVPGPAQEPKRAVTEICAPEQGSANDHATSSATAVISGSMGLSALMLAAAPIAVMLATTERRATRFRAIVRLSLC